jgi:putative SOS response-associated peptidase YedK
MCGRYRLSRRKQLIAEYFETDDEIDWEPRYNIAPSQPVGIIRQDPSKPERRFSLAHWGLIPSCATDASIGLKTINARSETITSKPAFRDAFMSRRFLASPASLCQSPCIAQIIPLAVSSSTPWRIYA